MAAIGMSPAWFPNYAFDKNTAVAMQGLTKSYKRISKLNRIKKESQRTFTLTCSECLTEFIVRDIDTEIICPVCNDTELE